MAIDSAKVKDFWDAQGRKVKYLSTDGIANLEEDPELLKLKVKKETEKIFSRIRLRKEMNLLDLGAGGCQWSLRFAPYVAKVWAVEYSAEMLAIARAQIREKEISNIVLIHQNAQGFTADIKFDIVFISGLLIYLNDNDLQELLTNLEDHTHPGTLIVLRDGTGLLGRYEINNRFSENLHAYYSAIYRTRETYIEHFLNHGFALISDEDMFEEGSPLNKWNETRLRLYLFRKN
jgi:cyclopropane fatty-acyl-phospholipid synthase-like methyltransferase